MRIKRNSWHYKLGGINEWNEDENSNLCKYFRGVLFVLFVGVFVVAFFAIFVIGLIVSPMSIPILIVILWALSTIILPWLTIRYLRKCNKNCPVYLPGEDVVVAYIKAKKSKICPMIKYVD